MDEFIARLIGSRISLSHVGGSVAVVALREGTPIRYRIVCEDLPSAIQSNDPADAEIELAEEKLRGIVSGKMNAQAEFIRGNIKVRGDFNVALAFSSALATIARAPASSSV